MENCDEKNALIQNSKRVHVSQWWPAFCHLDGCDSQRPNICLSIVVQSLDDFRGHPVRGPNHRVSPRKSVVQLSRHTKVSCRSEEQKMSEEQKNERGRERGMQKQRRKRQGERQSQGQRLGQSDEITKTHSITRHTHSQNSWTKKLTNAY